MSEQSNNYKIGIIVSEDFNAGGEVDDLSFSFEKGNVVFIGGTTGSEQHIEQRLNAEAREFGFSVLRLDPEENTTEGVLKRDEVIISETDETIFMVGGNDPTIMKSVEASILTGKSWTVMFPDTLAPEKMTEIMGFVTATEQKLSKHSEGN